VTKVHPWVLETELDILHPIHPDGMPKESDTGRERYLLGHSEVEIQRLINQASILRPTTERLPRSAGIDHGMRILDLVCGAGDVSMVPPGGA
jgi:hypothetical protein